MHSSYAKRGVVLVLGLVLLGTASDRSVPADPKPAGQKPASEEGADKPAKREAKNPQAWTLDEAIAALALDRHDAYLQYVALQLAWSQQNEDALQQLERLMPGQGGPDGRPRRGGRRDQVDLYSIFSGALAVQESLQLDTMRRIPPPKAIQGKRPVNEFWDKPRYHTYMKERRRLVAKSVQEVVKGEDGKEKTVSRTVVEVVTEQVPVTVPVQPVVTCSALGLLGGPQGQGPWLAAAAVGACRADERRELPAIPAQPAAVPPALVPRRIADDDAQTQQDDEEAKREKRRKEVVDLVKVEGPAIESHPWEKMLAGRKPAISPLARCVPADFYFAEFRSLPKLLEAIEISDLWATHLYHQAVREARTQQVGARVRRQLAVETSDLLRPFYDLVVEEVAVTGSDLYLREGSDVTLVFKIKQPEVFRARMDGFLAQAAKARSDAKRSEGKHGDIPYVHLTTPDRDVHVFSAYPKPDLHVRSNSVVALRRVLEAIVGKNAEGKAVTRLGDTAEFAYIRTLMPRGSKEEDGFIYLSDPFIRRQVGPRVKITERRRVLCYNHLRMMGHAALLYRTQLGKVPKSLDELTQAQYAPGKFGTDPLACPDGGKYTLSSDGNFGVCSHHGHAHFLTPGCENALVWVSGEEADEYQAFLDDYTRYWRTYFDPIAMRVQLAPERYRLETVVLPLIDNSIYSGLASMLGGKPQPLDALPVPPRNILSLNLRINKEALRRELDKQLRGDKELEEEFFEQVGMLALAPPAGFPAALAWAPLASLCKDPLKELAPDKDIAETLKKIGVPEKDARKLTTASALHFLFNGLGDQVGIHVYDAEPHVDFNLPRFFGDTMSMTQGGEPGSLYSFLLFLLTSANSPAYLSFSVQDAKIVDDFIDVLDAVSAALARNNLGEDLPGGPSFGTDFYRIKHPSGHVIRGNGIKLGPVTWRFFASRIDNVYYIATKQYIIEDLLKAHAERKAPKDAGPASHALVRVRPENWQRTLPDYRLGWAENNRRACLCNLGPLSNVGRAFAEPVDPRADYPAELALRRGADVWARADRLHTVHFFCPDGGKYALSRDARALTCTVHGSALEPRQPDATAETGDLDRLLRRFRGMTISFSFLEDGLRAIVTVERQ